MQLATDAALADAVDAAERKLRWRLLIDWSRDGLFAHPLSDLSGFVDDVDVTRDLASDLPAEVGLLQGAASAELTARLVGAVRVNDAGQLDPIAGAELSIAKILSPYRADSPLYAVTKLGCDIRYELGMMTTAGEKIIRQFTGKVRSIDVDRQTGQATINALDGSERFRRPITLGRGGASLHWVRKAKPHEHPFWLNSQVVIDQIARANGYYATPPSHPDSIYALTAAGGFAAEVGETRIPSGKVGTYTQPWWKPGPFGLLAPTGTWSTYATIPGLATSHYQAWEGTGLGMSAYVYWPGSVSGGASNVDVLEAELGVNTRFVLTVFNDGTVRARFKRNATTTSGPEMELQPGWNAVGAYWQFDQHTALNGGPLEIHTFANGLSSSNRFTSGQYGGVPAIGDDDWHRTVRTTYRTAIATINWSLFYMSPSRDLTATDWLPAPATFVPSASISVGLNDLAYVPDTAFEDSWGLLQEVVAAEAGLCGFDEQGRFFFTNRTLANQDLTVRKVISSLRALKGLAVMSSADGVRNVVTVTSQDGYMGSETTIWEPEDIAQLDAPPGETIFEVELEPNTLTILESRIPARTVEQWQDADNPPIKGFVVVRQDDNEVVVTSGVRAWFAETGPRIGELLVVNDKTYWIRFALPTAADSDPEVESTQPAFRISGYELVLSPEQVVAYSADTSIALHGERTLELPKTVWRQSKASGKVIAESILEFTDQPRPLLQDIPVVGDPRVQLGDLVQVSDPQGLGVITGYVVKIQRNLSRSGGLADTYAIRAA